MVALGVIRQLSVVLRHRFNLRALFLLVEVVAVIFMHQVEMELLAGLAVEEEQVEEQAVLATLQVHPHPKEIMAVVMRLPQRKVVLVEGVVRQQREEMEQQHLI